MATLRQMPESDSLQPIATQRSRKPKAKGSVVMPTRTSARLALKTGKMMDSAPSKTADAVQKAARVVSGRVSKKKAPLSKRAASLKALPKVQASKISKTKDSASLSEEDTLEEPPAMAPGISKKKGSATLSKAEDAPEKPLAGDSKKKPDGEVRLRKYRAKAPQAYAVVRQRAMEQRFFLIDRVRGGTADCPTECFTMTGSTGNVYTVTIAKTPQCNCPYAEKGHQCKHMIWIMIRVLRVRENLQYQLAYLSSELREIFENVPRTEAYGDGEAADKAGAGNRKPIEGEDCPICFTELGGEPTVFCKTACGNNFHSQCLKTWAATKKQAGAKVTCPLCRSPWDDAGGVIPVEDLKAAVEQGEVGDEGYVNVAGELGISQDRDYSTYHSFWVRRQRRQGMFLY